MVFQSLRALPAHERVRQPRIRPAPPRDRRRGDRAPRARRRGDARARGAARRASRTRSPAGSASGSRSAARSCAIPRCSCSTSRCPTSTRRSASACAASSCKLHHRLGATMIYVTHDQVEAMTMGERICIMNGGRVAQIGRPLECIATRPTRSSPASSAARRPTCCRRGSTATAARSSSARRALRSAARSRPARGRRTARSCSSASAPRTCGSTARAAHARAPRCVAVEPLGAETIVRTRLPGIAQDVLVRTGRTATAQVGDRLPLAFDLAAAHLFDPVTTRRLGAPS